MNPSGKSQAQLRSGEHQSNLFSSSSSSGSWGIVRSLSSSTWRGGLRIFYFCRRLACRARHVGSVCASTVLQQKSLMLLSSPQRCVRASEEFRGDRLAIKQARETPTCSLCGRTTASALCSSADGKLLSTYSAFCGSRGLRTASEALEKRLPRLLIVRASATTH